MSHELTELLASNLGNLVLAFDSIEDLNTERVSMRLLVTELLDSIFKEA
jgi:hypothetical protein